MEVPPFWEGKQSACPTLSVLAPPENRRIPGGSPDPLRRRKFHIICFRQKAESKFTTLRLLSKRDPLRWALVWRDEEARGANEAEKRKADHAPGDTGAI